MIKNNVVIVTLYQIKSNHSMTMYRVSSERVDYLSGQIHFYTRIWSPCMVTELMSNNYSLQNTVLQISKIVPITNDSIIIYDHMFAKTSTEYIKQHDPDLLTDQDKELIRWFNDGG